MKDFEKLLLEEKETNQIKQLIKKGHKQEIMNLLQNYYDAETGVDLKKMVEQIW